MSRRLLALALGLAAPLLLAACSNDDAYLGGQRPAYQCGARCWVEQGAPADAGDWFAAPETALGDAPEIVYPLSGSVHPEDLRQLTVQFRRGRADFEVFRLRVESPDTDIVYDFFTRCLSVHDNDGCRYLLKGSVWERARSDMKGHTVRLTVTGATGPHGVMRVSEPTPFEIVDSQLLNKGFYYWTNVPQYSGDKTSSLTGIYRLPFGADQAEPFIMPNTPTNEHQCGACHSVSQDGSTIAFTARDNDDGPGQRSGSLVVKLTARPDTQLLAPSAPDVYDSSMMTLTSQGKRVLVAYDDRLDLRSAEAAGPYKIGQVISSLTADDLGGKAGFFPEFSPTDDAVVLTLSDDADSAIAVRSGDIAVLDFDMESSSFSNLRIVVPGTASEFHFYPTWSPDGRYIAFASAPREAGEDGFPRKSYDQKQARLRLVKREGGRVYELKNATVQEGSWSTYPKFAPWQSGTLMFLTFNSKINYGLVLDNEGLATDAQRVAQLWMSAIDVDKLPDDPSSAPVWLPFQDASTSGHLGLWTKEVKCRTDLGGNGCDFGQICEAKTNTCVVVPK